MISASSMPHIRSGVANQLAYAGDINGPYLLTKTSVASPSISTLAERMPADRSEKWARPATDLGRSPLA